MGCPLLRRALRGSNVHANLDLRRRHRGLPDCPGRIHILQVANNWRNTDICHKLHVWILICKKYYFQGSRTPTGEALSMRSPSIQLWAAFRFLLELVLMYLFRLILSSSLSSILVFLDICSDVASWMLPRKSPIIQSMWKTSGPKYWFLYKKKFKKQPTARHNPKIDFKQIVPIMEWYW